MYLLISALFYVLRLNIHDLSHLYITFMILFSRFLIFFIIIINLTLYENNNVKNHVCANHSFYDYSNLLFLTMIIYLNIVPIITILICFTSYILFVTLKIFH